MEIKFDNGVVPIWKVRQGSLVRFDNDYFYIKFLSLTLDSRFELTLENSNEPEVVVMPQFVEWLEPV